MNSSPRMSPQIATIEMDGHWYDVMCHTQWDGIEHVGRLWFIDRATHETLPDRGAFPGRTADESIALARRLNQDELIQRCMRAQAEKRRYHGLRRETDELLAKVRYLNQLAISIRTGLVDVEGAAAEVDLTEAQMHEIVSRLRSAAGVELP
jgi:hypothetical protein